MVTMKDIAKEAGVSLGTVSNVLNKKGIVSAKKIKLVKDAANKLGYRVNYRAKELRSGETNTVGIIIPDYESEEYIKIYTGLDQEFKNLGYQTQLYASHSIEDYEKKIIKILAELRCIAVFTVSVLKNAKYYYNNLLIDENKIIFINRKPENAKCYCSFNFVKAGEEIGEFVKSYSKIGIFLNDENHQNQKDFLYGLKRKVNQENISVYNTNHQNRVQTSYDLVKNNLHDCIIANNIYNAKLIKKAYYYGTFDNMPKIIALSIDNSFKDNQIEVYQCNYYALGRLLASKMINILDGKSDSLEDVVFENNGLEKVNVSKQEKTTLKVLSVKTPTTDALIKIAPHFEKMTNIAVKVDSFSIDKIQQILTTDEAYKYDIIRIDMAMFPWFADKIFKPIEGLDEKIDQMIRELSETERQNYVIHNNKVYMVPFDPSVEMLFYRKDIFESPFIKRLFLEKTKKELKVPKSLEELVDIAEFFHEQNDDTISVEWGISINTKSIDIMGAQFLTFYYALGGKVDFSHNQVLFDEKVATRAIELYNRLHKCAMKDEGDWWENSVQLYSQGKVAMVIGYSNHLSKLSSARVAMVTGFTSTPGNRPNLGGGVIGITKRSNKIKEVAQFISWCNTKDIAREIVHLGGFSANKGIYEEKDIHQYYPWLSQVEHISKIGHRDTRTKEGNPINYVEFSQIIGRVIRDNINNLENNKKTIDIMSEAVKNCRIINIR